MSRFSSNTNITEYNIPKNVSIFCCLIYFKSVFRFYSPWKSQKNKDFLIFSGGIEMGHWLEIGSVNQKTKLNYYT